MDLTADQLNRATLRRQRLLERAPVHPIDGLRHLAVVQAQEPAGPYVALWNRVADFDPEDLDRALAERTVVKASLLRITLHAMAVEDHGTFRSAMEPSLRAAGLNDRRFRDTGVEIAELDAAFDHIERFAATPRRRDELVAALGERLDREIEGGVWRALRMVGRLIHAPTDDVWSFGQRPVFERAPDGPPIGHAEAVTALLLRVLRTLGPASVADLAQFTLLRRSVIRDRLADVELVEHRGPGGETLLDLPDGEPLDDGDVPAPPRLLGMWDNVLLAYADRSRVVPDHHRPHVIRRNGDVLPSILVDGRVAGVWRVTDDGQVEVGAFAELTDADRDGLALEARRLRPLIERDPRLFSRAERWWDRLPEHTDRFRLPTA